RDSRRCHSASFFRSTPRPMNCLRCRWKRSTGRGYQGVQVWLWWAHTNMLQYAEEVIEGKLPKVLHQAMVMKSFEFPDDPDVQQYSAEFGR
ncbi:MAG: hypothetical protein K8S94_12560, partial [Planctomycetia bacterium]|nr:hypothetical protein [Planctomycetia bacterium]